MKLTKIVYVLMPATIMLAFLWAPRAEILGHASRVLYFHMPLAWGSVLAFGVSGILSIMHLVDKNRRYALLDEKAYNSASIGMVFTILTIISGSMWAKISWGSYWNWDPVETSGLVTWLMYALILHGRYKKWWGKKATAVLSLSAFAISVLCFLIAGSYVMNSMHYPIT